VFFKTIRFSPYERVGRLRHDVVVCGVDLAPSKTEVAEFNLEIIVDKEVAWLNVSVHHVGCVEIVNGAQHIIKDLENVVFGQRVCVHRT